ncbi:hypothetical protein [Janthinobacterium sp.]|uniref:hypothetical protein n=1 Tax=Janthinobacterium sp. TaxID=1871054 RepID=UPI0025900AB6|nr:hypothetical protein [Janthinobacterium sp.]MCX7293676.1 hypothetical protein [Janthinobacterium sp.]
MLSASGIVTAGCTLFSPGGRQAIACHCRAVDEAVGTGRLLRKQLSVQWPRARLRQVQIKPQ